MTIDRIPSSRSRQATTPKIAQQKITMTSTRKEHEQPRVQRRLGPVTDGAQHLCAQQRAIHSGTHAITPRANMATNGHKIGPVNGDPAYVRRAHAHRLPHTLQRKKSPIRFRCQLAWVGDNTTVLAQLG